MPQTSLSTFDSAGFESFAAARPQPDWLLAMRREAWQHAETMQWPERRHEEWIRTDIRTFQIQKYPAPVETDATSAVDVLAKMESIHQLRDGVDLAGSIETFDSHLVNESIDESLVAKGVVFGSLERIAAEHPDLVREYLYTAFDPDYDKFAALHAAFWSGGQFLYVPRGVVIDRPLHIGSVMSDGGSDTSHTLIVLDEGAEATVLHECNSVTTDAKGVHWYQQQ